MSLVINRWITNKFPKTEDAVLIQKWFGSELNTSFHQVLAEGKESLLLARAKQLQADMTPDEIRREKEKDCS